MTDLHERIDTLAAEAGSVAAKIADEARDVSKAAAVELDLIASKVAKKVREAEEAAEKFLESSSSRQG